MITLESTQELNQVVAERDRLTLLIKELDRKANDIFKSMSLPEDIEMIDEKGDLFIPDIDPVDTVIKESKQVQQEAKEFGEKRRNGRR